MNILIAPDSFKGSLDAERVCRIIRYSIKRNCPDCKITELPLADGGEGTATLMAKALRGRIEKCVVEGPFGKPCTASVAFVDKGNTAIIAEMIADETGADIFEILPEDISPVLSD